MLDGANLHIFEFIHKTKYFRGEAMTRLGSSLKECLVSVEKADCAREIARG